MTEVPPQPDQSRLRSTFNAQIPVAEGFVDTSLPAATTGVEAAESRLRSTFVTPNMGEVGLVGAEVEVATPKVGIGTVIVNRDSSKSFEVVDLTDTKHGTKVNLIGPDGEKLVLGMDDLNTKLGTPDSPWRGL